MKCCRSGNHSSMCVSGVCVCNFDAASHYSHKALAAAVAQRYGHLWVLSSGASLSEGSTKT